MNLLLFVLLLAIAPAALADNISVYHSDRVDAVITNEECPAKVLKLAEANGADADDLKALSLVKILRLGGDEHPFEACVLPPDRVIIDDKGRIGWLRGQFERQIH